MAQEARTYETILITKVDMPQEGFDALIEKCKNIIKDQGKGEVLMCDDWQKAKIAYPIKEEPRGQWTYFRYKSLHAGVEELHRNLKINESVLRQFTARASDDAADYSSLRANMPKELAERTERSRDWKDDRPRRGGFKGGRGGKRFDGPRPSRAPEGSESSESSAPAKAEAPQQESGES